MPVGVTTPQVLSDSLPLMVADARIVREEEGTWQRTCDTRKLNDNTGTGWLEISLSQLEAEDITDTTENNNSQQIVDTLLTITPDMSQIMVKITDRTYRKIAAVVESKIGMLAGNSMARKKDEDYLSLFSGFGTGASPGTGNPLSHGHIAAAVNRITSNVTETSTAEVYTVLHGFQVYDIQSEVLAGVGTYTVPQGLTEETFRRGFRGTVANSNLFVDGNISVDATPDANGATHSRDGVVAVMGFGIKTETRRDPSFGGGADEIFMTDEYAFGERQSTANVWTFRHLSDATAPTS